MSYTTVYKRKPTKKEAASGCFPRGFKWSLYTTKSLTPVHERLREDEGGRTFEDPGPIITCLSAGFFPLPNFLIAKKGVKEIK